MPVAQLSHTIKGLLSTIHIILIFIRMDQKRHLCKMKKMRLYLTITCFNV